MASFLKKNHKVFAENQKQNFGVSHILHIGHIVAEFRRSPALVEHHHRHHAVVLTELIPDALLDRSPGNVIELNVC